MVHVMVLKVHAYVIPRPVSSVEIKFSFHCVDIPSRIIKGMAMAMIRVKKYVSTKYIAAVLCLVASISPVNSDPNLNHLSAKVQVVHPFQAMVLRATDISPIVFYGENGRVHMEYRPILPKFLFTVSLIGELMRGVGATVNEVLHRASVAYPVSHHGALQSPYYPYTYYKESSSSPLYQHSSTSNHHPEQRSRDDTSKTLSTSTILSNSTTLTNSTAVTNSTQAKRSKPAPLEISLSSQIRNSYIPPPLIVPTPPSTPQQNILDVISKAISGA